MKGKIKAGIIVLMLFAGKALCLGQDSTDEGLKQEVANMHYNLGAALQTQNKYDEAIEEFENDLKFNSDDADAHYNLALIYDKGKDNREQAIEHYKIYLKIIPDATDALIVKERLIQLEAEQKVWGNSDDPDVSGKIDPGRL